MDDTTKKPMLGSITYDRLRDLTQYGLPGLGTLYFTLATLFGFPYGEQVVGACAAFGIFFGILLGISNKSYNQSDARFDGSINVELDDPTKDTFTLEVDTPFDTMKDQDVVTLRVNKHESN